MIKKVFLMLGIAAMLASCSQNGNHSIFRLDTHVP